ncbi:MAG TPA: hypothetical protein VNF24_06425, partial [Candidatus Acidoferrales bacterium]|nr:hypothetical protein [Candidatus Acidoferrales bacterium]
MDRIVDHPGDLVQEVVRVEDGDAGTSEREAECWSLRREGRRRHVDHGTLLVTAPTEGLLAEHAPSAKLSAGLAVSNLTTRSASFRPMGRSSVGGLKGSAQFLDEQAIVWRAHRGGHG